MEELELARKKVIRLEDALRKLTEEGGGEKEVVGDVALGEFLLLPLPLSV